MLAEEKSPGVLGVYAKCCDCNAEYDEPRPGESGWKRRKAAAAPPHTQEEKSK
jgi:hypothetical protein